MLASSRDLFSTASYLVSGRLNLVGWALCLVVFITGCSAQRTVSGVWREVPLNAEGEVVRLDQDGANVGLNGAIYELNLGQYGDRVAGVSVRYQLPESKALAPFDRSDRCGCAFIVQGLIEELDNSEEDSLLFVAQGLTFSLYSPPSASGSGDRQETINAELLESPCASLKPECRRIFDLELVEGGDALVGETWCLDAQSLQADQGAEVIKRANNKVRFEPIRGIPEDVCEAE